MDFSLAVCSGHYALSPSEKTDLKFPGEEVSWTVLRRGELLHLKSHVGTDYPLVPRLDGWDARPSYLMCGGVVCQPLSLPFLQVLLSPLPSLRALPFALPSHFFLFLQIHMACLHLSRSPIYCFFVMLQSWYGSEWQKKASVEMLHAAWVRDRTHADEQVSPRLLPSLSSPHPFCAFLS
jgi:hypothetical protein